MMNENKRPVILLVFADDKQTPSGSLDQLPEELSAIQEALYQIATDGLCQVETIHSASLKKVATAFTRFKDRIAVFHFAGHANSYSIVLETPYRETEIIDGEGFSSFLANQKSLQLVFLNGCATRTHAEKLEEKGVPISIATQRKIKDDVAKTMAEWFYQFLGAGQTIKVSYQNAIHLLNSQKKQSPVIYRGFGRAQRFGTLDIPDWQIHGNKGTAADWSIPKAAENPLYLLDKLLPNPFFNRPFPNQPFPLWKPYSEDLAHVFWGRDYEIGAFYERLTAKNTSQIWLLYGASGVGKTSFLKAGLIARLGQIHTCYYEEQSSLESLKHFLKIISTEETTEDAKKQFIFLDGMSKPDDTWINGIKKVVTNHSNIFIVISIRSRYRDDWTAQLENACKIFHLLPLNKRGIQRFFEKLANKTGDVQVEDNLGKQVQGLLLNDNQASITTIFQYVLSLLWTKAQSENPSLPHLKWTYYEEWAAQEGWENFISTQLAEIDKTAFESGLLFQILQDCSRLETDDKRGVKLTTLTRKWDTDYLEVMETYRLISESAHIHKDAAQYIRLTHDILQIPLFRLLHRSVLDVQKIRRILQHYKDKNTEEKSKYFLSPSQIELIERYENRVLTLSSEEGILLNKSHFILSEKKKRRKALICTKVVISIGILCFGFLVGNPFLLVYIILLVVLYQG